MAQRQKTPTTQTGRARWVAPPPGVELSPPRPKKKRPGGALTSDELLALARREFELSILPATSPKEDTELEEVTEKLNRYSVNRRVPGAQSAVRTARDLVAQEQRKKAETRLRVLEARRAELTYAVRVPSFTREVPMAVLDELLNGSEGLQTYVASLVARLRRHDKLLAPLVAEHLGTE